MESGIYSNAVAREAVKTAISAGQHSIVQIANKTNLSIDDVYLAIESLLVYAEIFWVRKTDQWWLRRPNTMVVNTFDEAIRRARYHLRYESTKGSEGRPAWHLSGNAWEVRTGIDSGDDCALAHEA